MPNWLWRIIYWLGFRTARVWWWISRPEHYSAVVAVWLQKRILIVRQSYRVGPALPGGGIHADEDPRAAALRELEEELGLVVDAGDLTRVREMLVDWDFRRDHVQIFEMDLITEAKLKIDHREIVAAGFVDPVALLADPRISPVTRSCLERRLHVEPTSHRVSEEHERPVLT